MRPLWLVVFMLSFLLTACGYTSRSLMPQNVQTIYVPMFENLTFRRGLEFDLTAAMKNELLYKTRLKVADKDRADSALYGTITDVRELVLIEDPRANITEASVTIIVDFTWKDLRTGRTIMRKTNIQQQAEYVPKRKEDEGTASREAFVDLAEKIVALMEERW
jgi:hypothetical protein